MNQHFGEYTSLPYLSGVSNRLPQIDGESLLQVVALDGSLNNNDIVKYRAKHQEIHIMHIMKQIDIITAEPANGMMAQTESMIKFSQQFCQFDAVILLIGFGDAIIQQKGLYTSVLEIRECFRV